MANDRKNPIADFYSNRNVFVTGASGMLGTAYVSRLLQDTAVTCVYAIVRGGSSRLWSCWDKYLPPGTVLKIREYHKLGRLVIFEGDISEPNCGLTTMQRQTICDKVSVFVHGASTINLKKSLAEVAGTIIHPSLSLANLALQCQALDCFVYISSAYASTFLRETEDGGVQGYDAKIHEDFHMIRSREMDTAVLELEDIKIFGTTPEYLFVRHPYPYTYAKHLTERLLSQMFAERGLANKLLILRPSCIGPAVTHPYSFFEIPGSSPGTALLAGFITMPPVTLVASSHMGDPSLATVDEIPVDFVVNHLIAHVAFGSSGCVHAVAADDGRYSVTSLWGEAVKLRRPWWGRPRLVWRNKHWKSDELSALMRLFVICGCSFLFERTKSEQIWAKMNSTERHSWPLWRTHPLSAKELLNGRKHSAKVLISRFITKQYGLPRIVTDFICR